MVRLMNEKDDLQGLYEEACQQMAQVAEERDHLMSQLQVSACCC